MPAPASTRAVAAPIPAEAPVMRATRPRGSGTRGADGAGDPVAVAGDPAIRERGHEPNARQAEQCGRPAPAPQPAEDLGQRVGTPQHAAVREHQLYRLQARGLRHGGIARAPLRRLAWQELERLRARAPRDPAYAPLAQATGAVIDDDGATGRRLQVPRAHGLAHGLIVGAADRPAKPASAVRAGRRRGAPDHARQMPPVREESLL